MRLTIPGLILAVASALAAPVALPAQTRTIVIKSSKTVALPTPALSALSNAATAAQIREYVALSGELDAYRARWVAALDGNHSLGAPYWPESFWTAMKTSMEQVDLLPMFTTWFQHTVTQDLMQQIIATYRSQGADHFQGSPACFALGATQVPLRSEMDKLTLANTLAVLDEVYDTHKPEIKTARAAYLAAHPDYKDQ